MKNFTRKFSLHSLLATMLLALAQPLYAADYSWLYQSNYSDTAELRLTDFHIVGALSLSSNVTAFSITAALTNTDSGMFSQPQALLTNVPPGFLMPTNISGRYLFFPDIGEHGRVTTNEAITIGVLQPINQATNALIANQASFGWEISAWESPCFSSNTLVLDGSFSNSVIQVDHANGITWISNPPPQVSLVSTGWLVLPGADYPTNSLPVPDPFEVAAITSDSTLGIGLVANTNALNWLNWLCSAHLKVYPQGFYLQPVPRDFQATGFQQPEPVADAPTNDVPNSQDYLTVGGLRPPPPTDPPMEPPFTYSNGVELTNGVMASASMGLGQFSVDPEIEIRDFKVKKIQITVTAHPHATFRLHAAAAADFANEQDLFNYSFPLPPIDVGPGSVQLELPCRLYIGGQGSMSDEAELTLSQQADFEATFVVDGGSNSFTHTFTPEPLDFTPPQLLSDAQADAKIYAGIEVGASVHVKIEGVGVASAHGSASLEPYARLRVRPDETPWWTVYGGLGGHASLQADLLFWTPVDQTYPLLTNETVLLSSSGNGAVAMAKAHNHSVSDIAKSSGTDDRWSKIWPGLAHFGGRPAPIGMALKENGNVALAASTDPWFWLAELDRYGNSLWQKQYSLSSLVFAGMARVPNDGYVLVFGGGSVMRVDDTGNVRWLRHYAMTYGPSGVQVDAFRDTNGAAGIIVSGTAHTNIFAMRLDDDGGVVWANLYSPGADASAYKVRAASDGGFLVAGSCNTPLLRGSSASDPGALDSAFNGCVFKLNGDGTVHWATLCSANTLYDVAETPDGGAIAVGSCLPDAYTPFQGSSAHKFDSNGDVTWQTTYAEDLVYAGDPGPLGNSGWDEARAVIVTPGGYLVGGFTGYAPGESGAWLMRIRDNGDPFWHEIWDGDDYEVLVQLIDRGDCFLTLGMTGSAPPSGGVDDVWLSAVPHSGRLDFQNAGGITNYYRFPSVDNFAGTRWPWAPWWNAWQTIDTVEVYPVTVTTNDISVTTGEYWTPSIELAQAAFNPANGEPPLSLAPDGTNVALTWAVLGSEGFVPETSTNVTGPWTSAPGVVVRTNDDWLLQLSHTNSQRFFRLKK